MRVFISEKLKSLVKKPPVQNVSAGVTFLLKAGAADSLAFIQTTGNFRVSALDDSGAEIWTADLQIDGQLIENIGQTIPASSWELTALEAAKLGYWDAGKFLLLSNPEVEFGFQSVANATTVTTLSGTDYTTVHHVRRAGRWDFKYIEEDAPLWLQWSKATTVWITPSIVEIPGYLEPVMVTAPGSTEPALYNLTHDRYSATFLAKEVL